MQGIASEYTGLQTQAYAMGMRIAVLKKQGDQLLRRQQAIVRLIQQHQGRSSNSERALFQSTRQELQDVTSRLRTESGVFQMTVEAMKKLAPEIKKLAKNARQSVEKLHKEQNRNKPNPKKVNKEKKVLASILTRQLGTSAAPQILSLKNTKNTKNKKNVR